MSKYEEVMGALSAAQLCGVKGATISIQTMHETFNGVDVEQLQSDLDKLDKLEKHMGANGEFNVKEGDPWHTMRKAALLVLEFMKEQGNE